MLLIQDLTAKIRQSNEESSDKNGQQNLKNTLQNQLQIQQNIIQKTILQNFNLQVKPGIIGIIGQNGSGKSTLAKVLIGIGKEKLEITGKIEWENVDLLSLDIVQKAQMGIFLAFQNPPIIKGITTLGLLKAVLENKFEFERELEEKGRENLKLEDQKNQIDEQKELENQAKNKLQITQETEKNNNSEIQNTNLKTNFNAPKTVPNHSKKILQIIKENANKLQIGSIYRQKLENLSGGERKKMEILQLLCLEPSLVILDEVDSGLDELSQSLMAGILREFVGISKNGKLPILLVISHNSHFLKLLDCDQIIKIEKPI